MLFLYLYALVAGILTIIAPCIWPLLPIVLSTASGGSRFKPVGLVLGIVISFSFFTLATSLLVRQLGIDPDIFRNIAVIVIGFMGLSLIWSRLSAVWETGVSFLTSKIGFAKVKATGFLSGLIAGLALGIIWTPCAGPILATIVTISATQKITGTIIGLTFAYTLGAGIPLLILSISGQSLLSRIRGTGGKARKIQQFFGMVMITMAVLIGTGYDKLIQAKLLDVFPAYSNLLYSFEESKVVQEELNKMDLLGGRSSFLPALGKAPEIVGITNWLNSEPLTLEKLRGKVVLIDFWTYTCINCIRTLPFVTGWYEKYKDEGLVVIGVHTPEFEFEKKTENVKEAIKKFGINYPVAQDNDYATWTNYNNRYWPAHYLVDREGKIREVHFGEGNYEETEMAIRSLLRESGQEVKDNLLEMKEESLTLGMSPETYLGYERMAGNANGQIKGGKQLFQLPKSLSVNRFAFGGKWIINEMDAEPAPKSSLSYQFRAKKVFLVITPKDSKQSIKVYLDNKLIDSKEAGADVKDGQVKLDTARLYELVNLGSAQEGNLKLEFETGKVKVFAFTFG